jgi:hypothetical protein
MIRMPIGSQSIGKRNADERAVRHGNSKRRDTMINIRRNRIVIGAMMLAWAGPAAGATDAEKCEAAKNKIAGKHAFCRQKAEAKSIKTGDPVDYSKCNTRYGIKWARAEAAGGGTCPTSGDQAAMESCITAHTGRVAAALSNTGACEAPTGLPATGQTTAYGTGTDGDVESGNALAYADNGDGTITDHNTGLMWEKKDDSGGIHDVDNTYTWCANVSPNDLICDTPGNPMDGTVVTTFLATLNAGGGFAGYTDWRIPNVKELHSIIDYEVFSPSIDSVFHQSATCTGCTDVTATTCSCTALSYWSSTTKANDPTHAWNVFFNIGFVGSIGDGKHSFRSIRAVRGGL